MFRNSKKALEVVNKTVDSATKLLDTTISTDEEKLELKNKLSNIVFNGIQEASELKAKVIVAESSGSWMQRNWRPLVMLSFAVIVVYSKFFAPAFGLPNTELENSFWNLLELGIGGYVVGRSVEKVADSVTKNIDVSFLKKKNRNLDK